MKYTWTLLHADPCLWFRPAQQAAKTPSSERLLHNPSVILRCGVISQGSNEERCINWYKSLPCLESYGQWTHLTVPRPLHHWTEREVEENNHETKFQVSDEGMSSTSSPPFASTHYSAGKLQTALPSLRFPLALISMKVINIYVSQRGEMTTAKPICTRD